MLVGKIAYCGVLPYVKVTAPFANCYKPNLQAPFDLALKYYSWSFPPENTLIQQHAASP